MAASRGVRLAPCPPTMIGGPGTLHRLGQGRAVRHLVVDARQGERGPVRRPPQSGDDGQLLLEALEALAHGRERDAVGGVLGLVPTGPEAQLHPAAGHGVDPGHGDGQRTGETEGGRGDQGAQPDRGGVAGDAGQGDPGVAGAGEAVGTPHRQVVVAPEEGVEAQGLGGPGHGQQGLVGGALLGLGEDAQEHLHGLAERGARRKRTPCRPGSADGRRRRRSLLRPGRRRRTRLRPPPMATSSLGRSNPEVERNRTSFRNSVRANMMVASGTPSRKTEWSERTKDSRTPCWTVGGKAWSWAGLMEKLPLTWMPDEAAPGTSWAIQWLNRAMNTAPNSDGAERPAEGTEEGHRGGGRAHLGGRHGVLDGQHHDLHGHAHAGAEHDHVEAHGQVRRVQSELGEEPHAEDDQHRTDDGEDLVAAGPRHQLARGDRGTQHAHHHGDHQEAGHHGRHPVHQLEVERQVDDGPEHDHGQQEGDRRRDPEDPDVVEVRREDGLGGPTLPQHEGDDEAPRPRWPG